MNRIHLCKRRKPSAGRTDRAEPGAGVSAAVDISLEGLVLVDVGTGQPSDLAALSGRWLAVLIRHRW